MVMLPIPQRLFSINLFIAISRPACTIKNKTISYYATLPCVVCYVTFLSLWCVDYRSLKFCHNRQIRPILTYESKTYIYLSRFFVVAKCLYLSCSRKKLSVCWLLFFSRAVSCFTIRSQTAWSAWSKCTNHTFDSFSSIIGIKQNV